MTSEQFAYWLQGFSELNPGQPSEEQWQAIREHLATVFDKVTPPLGDLAQRLREITPPSFTSPPRERPRDRLLC